MQVAQAWGQVAIVCVVEPRLSKAGMDLDLLRKAVPELFDTVCAAKALEAAVCRRPKSPYYKTIKEICEELCLIQVPDLGEVPFASLLDRPFNLMLEHGGECECGGRTYLFGECLRCINSEAAERKRQLIEDSDQTGLLSQEPNEGKRPLASCLSSAAAAPREIPKQLHEIAVRRDDDKQAVRFVRPQFVRDVISSSERITSPELHAEKGIRKHKYPAVEPRRNG